MSKSQPNSTVIRLFTSLRLLPALLPSHSDICSSPQAPLQGHVICVLHRFHQDFQLCLESSPMGTEPDFQFQVLSHQGMVQGPETRLVHQKKVFWLCHQPKPFFFPQVLQFLTWSRGSFLAELVMWYRFNVKEIRISWQPAKCRSSIRGRSCLGKEQEFFRQLISQKLRDHFRAQSTWVCQSSRCPSQLAQVDNFSRVEVFQRLAKILETTLSCGGLSSALLLPW